MKLSQVQNSIKLIDVKVTLSDKLYNNSSLPEYGIQTRDVWLAGQGFGDWWVKLDRESGQIYPLLRTTIPWDELKDLEVVEIHRDQ